MTQGTHTSMQFLLTNYSGIDLTHSKYDKIILDSSIPKFLEKQGYQTIFVTSGRKDWHRMGDLLTSLGFDEILGWNDFKEIYPDADSNFYGGYEETVYDYILKRLQTQKKDKPLFIFFLTTNNHIPYHMPSHFILQTLSIRKGTSGNAKNTIRRRKSAKNIQDLSIYK